MAMVGDFGLTLNGCPIAGGQLLMKSVNSSGAGITAGSSMIQAVLATATACIAFKSPQEANGYYLDTTSFPGSTGNDPVQWSVNASAGNWSEWWTIGSSAWFFQHSGQRLFFPGLLFPTPVERNARVLFSAQPPWQWFFIWINSQAVQALGFCATAIAGAAAQTGLARILLIGTLIMVALGMAVAAVGYNFEGSSRDACWAWLAVLPSAIFAFGLVAFQCHILKVLLTVGLIYILVIVLQFAVLYPDSSVLARTLTTGSCILLIGLAGFGAIMRNLAVQAAGRLISGDQAAYDDIWAKIVLKQSTNQSLELLRTAVAQLDQIAATRCPFTLTKSSRARQYNSHYTSASRLGSKRMGILYRPYEGTPPGTLDWNSPVLSLDQLFVQAKCLAPILVEKVQLWAKFSCGYFPIHQHTPDGSAAVVRWEELGCDLGHIRWGRIKSVSRAIEKATRSYGKDVSRLLDLCRQSILFECFDDLIKCLDIIRQDPDVCIVQVKNRFDPNFNSAQTAGYRDVAINLRLANW
eukprot:CAMPEP_0172209320 /NCGR_PEP_ID=MMETSP1050-20130122/35049_1 /TAXON_ID=233186 /ORGANISM="Cryptomonas curvata, Strain CCAP979/52" /LENGTH=521 /DNA_ID=CAMNT_0012889183 /DNA_START=1344 /DNA_END=2906 /DNA_ORIENTATION=+